MNGNGQESRSESDAARSRLRECWELACVLNFVKVFEPIIDLEISAEDLEASLILPNKCLAQIHISLLKGIPPVSKNLKDPDAWVVALSKKLIMWWPWVSEGECPLKVAKGEEMSTYKKLDPTIRLIILKALCEIRADQSDVVTHINEAKSKNDVSTFRKSNIGEDGNGTAYWLDGNETIGLRLYKEVNTFNNKGKLTTINCQWETLATNRDEFQKIVDDYKASKSKLEVAVSAVVETEAIPLLDKIYKKKQRELQKKMNDERIMNNFCRTGITRSCRSRKPINYTFDDYDKTINEAIRESKRMKTRDEKRIAMKKVNENSEQGGAENKDAGQDVENQDPDAEQHVKNEDAEQDELESEDAEQEDGSMSTEADSESHEDTDVYEDSGEEESDGNHEDNKENSSSEDGSEEKETESDTDSDVSKSEDSNKENMNHSSKANNGNLINNTTEAKKMKRDDHCAHMKDFGSKKRLKQRPNRNTAFIVPDSEDEISSENNES